MNTVTYRNSGIKLHSHPTCGANRRYKNERLVVTPDLFDRSEKCNRAKCLNHSYETTTEGATK